MEEKAGTRVRHNASSVHWRSLQVLCSKKDLVCTLYHYTASFTGNYTEKSIFSIHTVKHTV